MKIKAHAALTAKSSLTPFEYEVGELGNEEVEVKVSHCGICHSDLAMIDNDFHFSSYPLVPGHEVIGTIDAVGNGVSKKIKIGQRVGIGWYANSCSSCDWCTIGKENLCIKAQPTIAGRHGGFAEKIRCHWKFAVPIPDGLASESAGPLMCAGSTVFAPIYEFGVRPWMRTAVVGIGGLGHLAVQFLAKMGCEVTAISSSHDKDAEIKKLGASRFIATRGTNELAKAIGSFDFILSTVSADIPWVDYIQALRPQGRLVICGLPENEIHFPLFPLLAEKSVSGGINGSPSNNATMLDFAARLGVKPLIELFPVQQINQALDHVRAGKARFRAVLEM